MMTAIRARFLLPSGSRSSTAGLNDVRATAGSAFGATVGTALGALLTGAGAAAAPTADTEVLTAERPDEALEAGTAGMLVAELVLPAASAACWRAVAIGLDIGCHGFCVAAGVGPVESVPRPFVSSGSGIDSRRA